MNSNEEEKQAERIEADLKKHFGVAHGFTVPEGYFNDLNKSIANGIEQEERSQKGKVRRMRFFVIAAAACVALLLTLIFNITPTPEEQIADDPEPVLDEYYFEYEELKTLFEEEELPLAAVTVELNDEEMAEYVEANSIELEYLLEEI